MPEHALERFLASKERNQRALIDFLNLDLDLAVTFLEMAKSETGLEPEHSDEALGKARIALQSIRQFQGRIEDPMEWQRIQDRADELVAILDRLSEG